MELWNQESHYQLLVHSSFLFPRQLVHNSHPLKPQTLSSLFSFSADNLSDFTERIVLHQHFTSFPFDCHFSVGLPDTFMLLEILSSLDFQESALSCFSVGLAGIFSSVTHQGRLPTSQSLNIGISRAHSMYLFSFLLSFIPLLMFSSLMAINTNSYVYCCNLDISRTSGSVSACLH